MWQLTVDCTDPRTLVDFWSVALGYVPAAPPEPHATWNDHYRALGVPEDELDPTGDGTDRIVDPTGAGPRIWFQAVPEAKTGKNRLHLDVYPAGRPAPEDAGEPPHRAAVEEHVARLVACGGTVVRRVPGPHDPPVRTFFVVMRDPEGNEFCVG